MLRSPKLNMVNHSLEESGTVRFLQREQHFLFSPAHRAIRYQVAYHGDKGFFVPFVRQDSSEPPLELFRQFGPNSGGEFDRHLR